MSTRSNFDVEKLVLQLKGEGFAILEQGIPAEPLRQFRESVADRLAADPEGIKSLKGETYAARNVLDSLPESLTIWQRPEIIDFLTNCMGSDFGLVRGLFFDKHPQRTWSLGWHKDMTIAVEDNTLPTTHFCKPTKKSNVPHVEASEEVLNQMVTLRIHLDEVTDENGPLEVIPKSHLTGKQTTESSEAVVKIHAQSGDILAMKPLISHASGSSTPGTTMHRRILHLEFAANRELADGYQWYHFIQPGPAHTI